MFIATGSFIIRGKRNFLQPQRLELGFTLMFCVSEESLANHIGERNRRDDAGDLEEQLSLSRAQSTQSALTEEQDNVSEASGAQQEMSTVDRVLMQSQASFKS